MQQEKFETAQEILEPLVVVYPERNDLRVNYAIALVNTGHLDDARFHAQAVLKNMPNNPTALELMGILNAPEQ